MKYNPADYVKYSSNLTVEQKLMSEIRRETARTMGLYGKRVENAVNEQRDIFEQLENIIDIDDNSKIRNKDLKELDRALKQKVMKLVEKYNDYRKTAKKYQYYLNVQKECLHLLEFDRDPYKIMPELVVDN